MDYFLGINEINKVNETNLDEIKCIYTRYKINDYDRRFFDFSHAEINIENNTIVCRYDSINQVVKHIYPGKLESGSDINLPSYKSHEISWKRRVHFDIIEDKDTLLYIRNKSSRRNLLFHNESEFLRLNYVVKAINQIIFYNNYLAIVTRYIKTQRTRRKTEVPPIHHFIIIKVIPKSDNEFGLVALFQTNLNEIASFAMSHVKKSFLTNQKCYCC